MSRQSVSTGNLMDNESGGLPAEKFYEVIPYSTSKRPFCKLECVLFIIDFHAMKEKLIPQHVFIKF